MAVPFHGAAVGLLVAAHVCSAHGANATPSANATSRRLAFVGKTVLPDLWFIGASKCATTTLADLSRSLRENCLANREN